MDINNISSVIEREDAAQSSAQHKLSGFISVLVQNIEQPQEKSFRFEFRLGVVIKLPATIKLLEFIKVLK